MRAATRSRSAARSPVGVLGQSVVSSARRAAAIACWTCSSVATSTSVTTVPSLGLITLLQVPSPDATHSPSMNRLGTGSLDSRGYPGEGQESVAAPTASSRQVRRPSLASTRYPSRHEGCRGTASPPASRPALASSRPEALLRRRDHRRGRARPGGGLLPREDPRHHERGRRRARLAGRREHGPQHRDHPQQLPVGRERRDLRARPQALGGPRRGARLRPALQPARRAEPRPQPGRRPRGHPPGLRQPAQRRRRRVARARRRQAPLPDRRYLARRPLPGPRRDLSAARRDRASTTTSPGATRGPRTTSAST